MKNEQLAELIGKGGNDDLLPELWENMKKIYFIWANRYYIIHKERCDLSGITAEDLRQESYLSMLDAIKAYTKRTAEQSEIPFISFCRYPFLNYAAKAIGVRTGKQEVLNHFRKNLDEPLEGKDGDSNETLATTTPDPEAEQPFRDIEKADYCRSVREIVANILSTSPRELEIIERNFYENQTLYEISKSFGISVERINQLEKKAFKKLKKSVELKKLMEINVYQHVGIKTFERCGSIVEMTVEYQEELKSRLKNVYELIQKQK